MSWAGNLIKVARLKTGLSQTELARRAGTSQPTIAAYEAGRKEPSVSTLARVVRAAGVDLRMGLGRLEDDDEWLRRLEGSLPPDVVRRARLQREALRSAGREEAVAKSNRPAR